MKNIDLSKLTQNIKVISGRDRGMELREKLKIDEKDIDEEIYEFEIAQDVYSFNSSGFLGLFSDSIKKLGEKKFREKYQFKCSELIRMNIEDGIRDAVNKANPLG